MVAISAPSTILLTGMFEISYTTICATEPRPGSGANGYIAGHVVKAFLDQGFSVRGTVRSAAKGVELQKVFAGYGERFEYFVIPDFIAVSTASRSPPRIQLTSSCPCSPVPLTRPSLASMELHTSALPYPK